MGFLVATACLIVACQVLWMGHTLLGRNPFFACGSAQQEATSFLVPPKSIQQQQQKYQYIIQPVVNKLARAFPKWQHIQDLCVPAEPRWWHPEILRSPAAEGILFVRNMKTASSTLAGVAIRIARRLASGSKFKMCKVRFDHTPAFQLQYAKRNPQKSFLWSFLRDPTDRAVSEFFHFGVSRLKMEPSDENFKRYMLEMRKYHRNYFLLDMALQPYAPIHNPNFTMEKAIHQIMKHYDFIGLVERMDESLVLLKMILNLELNDVLYLSAKRNGGWDEGAFNATCIYIVPSFVSKGMQTFFNSKRWREYTAGDRLLFQAVNKSIDLTINAVGRSEFEAQLREYRMAQKKAQQVCGPSTVYPCSEGGLRQRDNHSCLWWDSGCGYKCLDSLKLNEEKSIDGII
jgi:hypothetical protein